MTSWRDSSAGGSLLAIRTPCPSGSWHTEGPGRELSRIIRQVAAIARRLHAAGYNHRDLNCYHFLIKECRPGAFDIRLIDLQRLQRRRWLRRRWIVKDLCSWP